METTLKKDIPLYLAILISAILGAVSYAVIYIGQDNGVGVKILAGVTIGLIVGIIVSFSYEALK